MSTVIGMSCPVSKLLPFACFATLIFGIHCPLWAHYLWLDGSDDNSSTQAIFNIDIRVGDDMEGEPLANDLSQYEIFNVYRNGKSEYVRGERGRIPAGYVEDAGDSFAIYYRSVSRSIVMQQADFLRHLVAEGLRQQFDQYDELGRPAEIEESYTHHAVLLAGQTVKQAKFSEVNGALMLSPDFDLGAADKNSPAGFQLTYRGQPIENAPVTLRCTDQSQPARRLYTSSEGRVAFDQLCEGDSLLHTIYLKSSNSIATKWESHWLSLTLHRL